MTPRPITDANPTYSDAVIVALQNLAREERLDPQELILSMKKKGVRFEFADKRNDVLSDQVRNRIVSHFEASNARFFERARLSREEISAFNRVRIGPHLAHEPPIPTHVVAQTARQYDLIP